MEEKIDTKPWELLDSMLAEFRSCFSRKKTYVWFVVLVVGFMIRSDHLGVTDVIRDLRLSAACYIPLIRFFRSSAWNLCALTNMWCRIVCHFCSRHNLLEKHDGKLLLVGDGVKQSKEGRFMAAVKRLFQESGTSSKLCFFFGCFFGAVGIVLNVDMKRFCLPLSIEFQDGLQATADWFYNNKDRADSHGVAVLKQAYRVAVSMNMQAILLLDAYFLGVPLLVALQTMGPTLQIVTRAKSNCRAYQEPQRPGQKKRGRPKKKGEPVKIAELFNTEIFTAAKVMLYGQIETVEYHSVDLLWGLKLYKKLRFVLCRSSRGMAIFVSTDLALDPVAIIELYGKRFSIEGTFREFKQVVTGFGFRFWTKYMPKLSKFKKKTDPDRLVNVKDPKARKAIMSQVKACEGYVFISLVALGILQMLSLIFSNTIPTQKRRWQRTVRKNELSEASMQVYLRQTFFAFMSTGADFTVNRIIQSKQFAKSPQDLAS